ncbi:MAG: hypothetical protein RBT22_05330 [Aliarcobacter sp.]|nr:hypothetical protein [Aliarcobacter sp.]
MNTKILLIGQVYAVAKKMYKEEEVTYVQFLNKSENGGVEIQQVKLTDKNDSLSIKEGVNVKIPVKVSSFENKMFFTQSESILKS